MIIKQLSIFIENTSGKLSDVTCLLGDYGYNISALSIADTKEFGILRLIVSNPDEAFKLLKENGYSVSLTDVICLATPNVPGALSKALKIIADAELSVEYMYAFNINEKANIVLKMDDPEQTIKVLNDNQLEVVKAKDLYNN